MSEKIKIISYNICALPWWSNIFGDPIDRVNKIIDFLKKTDADIICLQEVFDLGVLFIMRTKLHEYYFNSPSKSNNFLNSGLVICCKTKFIKKNFEKYNISCGEDMGCDKGFMYVTVKIKRKLFTIINTHLNADAVFCTTNYCEQIRMKQIDQLLNKLSKTVRHDILFCGDFNIDFNTIIGKKIYNKISDLSCSCINSKKMITYEDDNIQYDQIFYIPKISSPFNCQFKVFNKNKKKLSDHYPIQLILTKL